MNYTVDDAILVYMLRQAGKVYPHGVFDKAGRWYPEDDEERPCCDVYPPSRRYKYTLLQHCRTLKHVAELFGVNYKEALRESKKLHWKAVEKLLSKQLVEPARLEKYARPTLQEYANALVQQACAYLDILTADELSAFAQWIRRYNPEVDTMDWNAEWCMRVMQRSE